MRRETAVVHGRHAVEALLERDAAGVLELFVLSAREGARHEPAVVLARAAGIAIHEVPSRTLARLAGTHHQGIVARYRPASSPAKVLDDVLEGLTPRSVLLVLEEVQDPHNLGACLRSAAAAGVDAVLVPRHRSATLTPAARKVASGAAERIPLVRLSNLARDLGVLRAAGVQVIGTDASTPASLFEAELRGPVALVLGGEQRGLRRLTREGCDLLVRIPMARGVESLNVSVAAGICMFEATRRGLGGASAGKS